LFSALYIIIALVAAYANAGKSVLKKGKKEQDWQYCCFGLLIYDWILG
jgi:hypothetical protein